MSHVAKGWIKKPATFDIPKIDNAELEKLVQKYEGKYLDIVEDPSIELIDELIDELYVIRGESISAEGEFGLGNLLFKEFRRLGYLDELKDLKVELVSKQLSL